NSNLIHLPDRRYPSFAQPGIARLETAVSKDAAVVVGDLHDAHTQIAEHLDARGIVLEKCRVLKTWKDANLVLPLGPSNIRVFANDPERIGILLHQRFEPAKILDRILKIPLRHRAINRRNPRL